MEKNEIFALLRERIVGYGRSLVRGGLIRSEDIEDLAQESIVVLERKYAHVTALEELVRLGIRISQLKAKDLAGRKERRAERTGVSVDDSDLTDIGLRPDELLEAKERTARMVAAIRQLGQECREIVRLQFLGVATDDALKRLRYNKAADLHRKRHRCYERLRRLMGEPGEVRL